MTRFGLLIALIALLLSLAALPAAQAWFGLSWWKVFRRCVSVAAAGSLAICIWGYERRTFRSYGLPQGREAGRELLRGALLGIGALGVMLGLGLASQVCRVELTPDRLKLCRTAVGFVPAALVVGVLEELVFRGYLLRQFLSCSRLGAIAASSALYAVVHVRSVRWESAVWMELMGLMLLGVVLAVASLRTGGLGLAIGLHAALAYGARVNKLVFHFTDDSLAWLTGTSRLVNGLAGWVALVGLGALIVWWTNPSHSRGG